MEYSLTIDQGTTGTTICLHSLTTLQTVAKLNTEFKQHYPAPGLVEHSLYDIWQTVEVGISKILSDNQILPSTIACIGITNQRETTCAFDNHGNPLYHAIVWQDKRTSKRCQGLKQKFQNMFRSKTGLPIDPYFSATKMEWLMKNVDTVKKANLSKTLRFGTIDTFILFKLTGGESFRTDLSNASRTLLCNIHTGAWDKELLKVFKIPSDALPEICDSFGNFGMTKGLTFLPDGIPITGILGDQQSALFGHGAVNPNDIKCTYGTGAFVLMNTGNKAVVSKDGLLTTVAYKYRDKTYYALEGSSFIAGAAIQWLRDELKIIESSKDSEIKANKINNLTEMTHLLFIPFLSGAGSPYWRPEAKGAIIGITRDTNQNHLCHAALDGIALSVASLLKPFSKASKKSVTKMYVDGGACSNELLLTLQATYANTQLTRPNNIEVTSYGAFLASAVGANLLDISKLKKIVQVDKTFNPSAQYKKYCKLKVTQWESYIKSNIKDL